MNTLRAHAKINLGLRILNQRDDGYHDLETVFHRIDLFDEIILERATQISMHSSDPSLTVDEDNLCVRAAQLLQRASRTTDGVHISLGKKIPIGAGLGGGSSDAATTLLGLNNLWQLHFSIERLQSLALQLGSDVPFFLTPGTAHATGRGEILNYFQLDIPYWIVLIYPNIHVSTAWAYKNLSVTPHRHKATLKNILIEQIARPKELQDLVQNEFEPLVFQSHPEVAAAKKQLEGYGAVFVRMSGSGSSLFGFFAMEKEALFASGKMENQYRVFLTPPHFKPPTIAQ